MIMMLHLPFILTLFALGMGVCLYVWSVRNTGAGVSVAKFFGMVIILLSLVTMFCVGYTAYIVHTQHQMPMGMNMMQGRPMMGQGSMPKNVPPAPTTVPVPPQQ